MINNSISNTNATYGNDTTNGNGAVRPMFYLNEEKIDSLSGVGTLSEPFVVTASDSEKNGITNLILKEGKVVVSFKSDEALSGNIIVAAYDNKGGLISMKLETIENEISEYSFEIDGIESAACIKAMAFEDMDSMIPLCKSKVL